MKNKFLVMAVMTSMVAALMAPAVFAVTGETPAVTTNIPEGTLTLQGAGAYADPSIALTGIATPPVVDESATFSSNPEADYFTLTDTTSMDGAKVSVKTSSDGGGGAAGVAGDFAYTGFSSAQLAIPAANFVLVPNVSGGSYVAPTASNTGNADDTFIVDTANTAADGEVLTNYSFIGTTSLPMTSSNQIYFRSTASGPLVGTLRLDRLVLTVPGGSNAGDYAATLVITATDGSGV
jgi:hypothetical protein